ncbi:adenosylcobinamide-GDP ribazoletransferase [Chamaesiphon sp. OTE_20_metabat_361]|uniref:adenosylcobinamide-GDP ribazoletransferase n=1 Tax=Chamaesiphon sp. OTE_20_metabat_361 TaxID=2964689 RepID=UPI00286BABCB|nr:adenosylcobinamide-GDP ribazoletransferase [Chamaesiphon sp. OTE_20_metabat_361]
MLLNLNSLLAALTFYTCIPVSANWQLNFARIARWAPIVGLGVGGGLGAIDFGLAWLHMPILVRSGLVVVLWIWWTGGLHLDGAMDAADGLAVQDPERRLLVMSDSVTGAFGAMVAVVIILLKTCALAEIPGDRLWVLGLAAGWSRWGQVLAIALYPYLKVQGKGAFHQKGLRVPGDILLGLAVILAVTGCQIYLQPAHWLSIGSRALASCGIAVLTGYYFHRRLGGHTGDTYGAVVEWTEAFILCLWTIPSL